MARFNIHTAIFRGGRFIDLKSNIVALEDDDVELTQHEVDVLATHQGSSSETANLLSSIAKREISSNNVRVTMYKIKRKLEGNND